jgi:putative AdoMet-dependent methyltransferase
MISTYRHLEFIWRNLLWKIGPLLFRAVALVTKGYLQDVVFSFAPDSAAVELESWIEAATKSGSFSRAEFEAHIRDEFSTYGSLMEDMIQMAGFTIQTANYYSKVQAEFVCRRA